MPRGVKGTGQETATPLHRLVVNRNLNQQRLGELYKKQELTSNPKRWERLSDKMDSVNKRLKGLDKRIESFVEDAEPRGKGRPTATMLHKMVVDREVLAKELEDLQTDLEKAQQMGAPPIILANLQDRFETSFQTYKVISKKIEDYIADRDPAGKGIPQEKTFFKSAKASYKDVPASELDGYTLVVSTPTLKAYLKDKSLLIALRGTKVSDKQDLIADANIAINRLASSARYKKDKATIESIVRKYRPQEYEYYLSGHSLGGAIANQLKYDFPFIRNSVQFNPAFQPKDLVWSQGNDTKRLYTDKDGLYQLGGKFFVNKQVIPASSSTGITPIDAISGHVLSNFASLYGEPVGDGVNKILPTKNKMKKKVSGGRVDPVPKPSVPSAVSAGPHPALAEFMDEVDASDIYRLSEILEILYDNIQTDNQGASYHVINNDIDNVIDGDEEANIDRVRSDIIDLYRSIYFGTAPPYTTGVFGQGVTGGAQDVSIAELERRFNEMRSIAEDNIPDDVYDELEVLDNHRPNFDNAVSDLIAALKSRAYHSALAYYLYLLEDHSSQEIGDKLYRLTAQGGGNDESLLGQDDSKIKKHLQGNDIKTLSKSDLTNLLQDLGTRNKAFASAKKDFFMESNGKRTVLKYGTPEWKRGYTRQLAILQKELEDITGTIMREFERREETTGGADEDPRAVEEDEDPQAVIATMSPKKALAFLRRKGLPNDVIERILDYTFQRASTNPTGKGSKNAGFVKMLYAKRVLKKKPEDYPTRDKKAPKKFVRSKIGSPSANLVAKFPGGNPLNRPFKAGERKTLSPAELAEVRKLERERKQKSLASKREKVWNALSKPQQTALLERFKDVHSEKRLLRAQNVAVKEAKGSGFETELNLAKDAFVQSPEDKAASALLQMKHSETPKSKPRRKASVGVPTSPTLRPVVAMSPTPERPAQSSAPILRLKGSGIIDTLAKTPLGKKIGELGVRGLKKLGKVIVDDLRKRRGGMMPQSIRTKGEIALRSKEMILNAGLPKDTQDGLYDAEVLRSKETGILDTITRKEITNLQKVIDRLRLAPKNQHKQIIQEYFGETPVTAPALPREARVLPKSSGMEVVANPLSRLTGKGRSKKPSKR